jgi:hypothetical protein
MESNVESNVEIEKSKKTINKKIAQKLHFLFYQTQEQKDTCDYTFTCPWCQVELPMCHSNQWCTSKEFSFLYTCPWGVLCGISEQEPENVTITRPTSNTLVFQWKTL